MESALHSALEAEELLLAGEWAEANRRLDTLRGREECKHFDLAEWDSIVAQLQYFRTTIPDLPELDVWAPKDFRKLDDLWGMQDRFIRGFPVADAPLVQGVRRDADQIMARRKSAGEKWVEVLRSNFKFSEAIAFLNQGPSPLRPDADSSALARERDAHSAILAYLDGRSSDPTTGLDFGIAEVRQRLDQLPAGERLEATRAAVDGEWRRRARQSARRLLLAGLFVLVLAALVFLWYSGQI